MPKNITETLETINALNIMASYIGIPPLRNLGDLNSEPDFVLAQKVLDDVRVSTLSQGLPCNTDYNLPLDDTDINGDVLIPDGALICDMIKHNLVERDGIVYDLNARANYKVAGVKADIIWNWSFDSLPMLVKMYITITASRAFVARSKGDAEALNLTIPDERRVKQEFQRYVYEMGDISILDSGTAYLVARAGRNQLGFNNRY